MDKKQRKFYSSLAEYFNPIIKSRDGVFIDETCDVTLETFEFLMNKLENIGIEMTDEEHDKIYDLIFDTLEMFSNGSYRSHL